MASTDLNAQRDYYATEQFHKGGVKLVRGRPRENHQFILLQDGNEQKKLTPQDIESYGFANGEKFVTREISVGIGQSKRVFLKVIRKGKLTLYGYKPIDGPEELFLEVNGQNLRRLSGDPRTVRAQILTATHDREWNRRQDKVLKGNKISAKRFISLYNRESTKTLPHAKLGLRFGLKTAELKVGRGAFGLSIANLVEDELFLPLQIDFGKNSSVFLGGFVELPILSNDLFFVTEINIVNHKFEFSPGLLSEVEITALELPVRLKYGLPTWPLRPHVSLGFFPTQLLRNSTTISIGDDVSTENFLTDTYFGTDFTLGLDWTLAARRVISFHFRRANSFQLRSVSDDVKIRQNEVALGIAF